jgi:hypothetical protein
MHVTTHVNNPPRTICDQLSQEPLVTSLPRGIDNESSLSGWESDICKESWGICCNKYGFRWGKRVQDRVAACKGDAVRGDIYASSLCKRFRAGYCEQAGTAVGINKIIDFPFPI